MIFITVTRIDQHKRKLPLRNCYHQWLVRPTHFISCQQSVERSNKGEEGKPKKSEFNATTVLSRKVLLPGTFAACS